MRFTWILFIVLFATCKKDQGHDSLLGQWRCEEFRESGTNTQYYVSITHDPIASDTSIYVISNFYQLGNTDEALVRIKLGKNGIITIPNQIVLGNGISGSGTVKADYSEINLTYLIQSASINEQVEATYN